MLKTKKTFHLINDEEKSQREHMYQRKNCRWGNYIVLPVLIGFALLLILVNVDFTGTAYDIPEVIPSTSEAVPEATLGYTTTSPLEDKPEVIPSTSEAVPDSTLGSTTTSQLEDFITISTLEMEPEATLGSTLPSTLVTGDKSPISTLQAVPGDTIEYSLLWGRSNCFDVTYCLYLCDFGTVGSVANTLEKMQSSCNTKMTLVLQQCSLPSGRLKQDFLTGSYQLENFTIDNCGLQTIEEGAFEHVSTKTLAVLQLKHSLLITLDSTAFMGLSALQHFTLTNVQQYSAFKAPNFLQPLASTLEYVELQHQSDKDIYDPTYWLGGEAEFTQLHSLNMSGNRFATYLRKETFSLMGNLQKLYLSYSEITHIDNGTFDSLMDTLELLDLSHNQLLALSWDFLGSLNFLVERGFQLLVHDNPWNCSCDNKELIDLMHLNMNSNAECSIPEILNGTSLSSVQLECGDYGDNVTTTTTSITITAEDSNSSDADSSSYTSETEESGEPSQEDTTTSYFNTTTPSMATPSTSTTVDTTTISSSSSSYTSDTGESGDPSQDATTTSGTTPSMTTTPNPTAVDTTSTTSSPSQSTNVMTTTTTGKVPPIMTTTTTGKVPPEMTTENSIPTTDSQLTYISVECTQGNSKYQYPVSKRDVTVKIATVSPTSVRLYIGNDVTQFRLVYFYQNSDYHTNDLEEEHNTGAVLPKIVTRTAVTNDYQEILIDRLFNNQTYTFCLVRRTRLRTSPFNCFSHHLYVPVTSTRSWLEDDDIAWFVSLVVLSVMLCIYIGLHITYCLLRVRPKLLRGSVGVQPINDHSNKVLLFPTKSQITLEEQQVFSEYIKKHGSLSDIYSSDMSLQMNSHDYMQFYRNLEQSKIRNATTIRQENGPPAERAPQVPATPSNERPNSSRYLIQREATIYEDGEENQYESVEYYYQELY